METQWEIVCPRDVHRQPPQAIFSLLILGSGDLDSSVMLDSGEIVDTGSDYEDQVIKPKNISHFKQF